MKTFVLRFLFLFVAVWLVGFVAFALYVNNLTVVDNVKTDAIVVLTGGSERVAVASELFRQNKAKKLFISGVGGGANIKAMTGTDVIADDKKDFIELGRYASNTRENAIETAEWVTKSGIKSILLVTAYYHMPRSYLEFSKKMPDIDIIKAPVFPRALRQDKVAEIKWQFVEYNKFLIALFFGAVDVVSMVGEK